MKETIKKYINRISEDIAERASRKNEQSATFAKKLAFRVASESILNSTNAKLKPNDVFYGVSDDFWFWLHTEGVRANTSLQRYLPSIPDEYTQEIFTGNKGDTTLAEGFDYYKIFREQYQKYNGDLSANKNILDFGCGWGRIIRFFIKDLDPANIWGCDPVPEMIELCKTQNRWCNFKLINTNPPSDLPDNNFDLIYSYSVLSHLSEDFHLSVLGEIYRLLKPGGIYITTTRNRKFIEDCAALRLSPDLKTMGAGSRSSSQAFPDTASSLKQFDTGLFTHHSFNDVNWPYWGETAIPKKYVQDNWSKSFKVLDFLELDMQNVIVVQKPL